MSRIDRVAAHLLASKLYHASRSIRAIVMGEFNEFTDVLQKLRQIAEKNKIPIALVGGLAGIHHGSLKPTEDVDVNVSAANMDRFLMACRYEGFKVRESKSGWHILSYKGVEIDVVPEGGRANKNAPTTIPGPETLGVPEGLGFACLKGWMELKLSANRGKDLAAVIELIKRAKAGEVSTCQQHLAEVHPDYLERFNRLYQEAQEEIEQESERGASRFY